MDQQVSLYLSLLDFLAHLYLSDFHKSVLLDFPFYYGLIFADPRLFGHSFLLKLYLCSLGLSGGGVCLDDFLLISIYNDAIFLKDVLSFQ